MNPGGDGFFRADTLAPVGKLRKDDKKLTLFKLDLPVILFQIEVPAVHVNEIKGIVDHTAFVDIAGTVDAFSADNIIRKRGTGCGMCLMTMKFFDFIVIIYKIVEKLLVFLGRIYRLPVRLYRICF